MLAMTIGRFFQLIGSACLMIERFTFPVMHSTQNFMAAPSPPPAEPYHGVKRKGPWAGWRIMLIESLSFADHVLSAFAARKSRKRKRLARVPASLEGKENFRALASSVKCQTPSTYRHLRLSKYSASVAVKPQTAKPSANPLRLTALPSSPYVPFSWTAFVGMSKLGSEVMRQTSPSSLPLKEGRSSPTEKE
jgi:hypothetical protein